MIWGLSREFAKAGIDCRVAGLNQDVSEKFDAAKDVTVITGKTRNRQFGYSPELRHKLGEAVNAESIIHNHGLWMYPGLIARKNSRRSKCPLVISPHGMLEPWALKNSPWKKRVAAWLFEDRNLHSAQCLHALCNAEAQNFRRYGLRNPIAVIPNGVDFSDPVQGQSEITRPQKANGSLSEQKTLLFLSRLHPKKGLDNLLEAWGALAAEFSGWRLVIAGAGEPTYEQKLKHLVRQYQIEKSVVICGPVYGEEKQQLLAAADGFVLPSFSEGFSMAVLEAAAAGLPVVLTPECNFPELVKAGAALEVYPNPPAIEIGLRRLLTLSDQERKHMGSRGRNLVRQSYTWPAVAEKMLGVYRWLAGVHPKPECVFSS